MAQPGTLAIGRGLPQNVQIDIATFAANEDGRASSCKAEDIESGTLLTCSKFWEKSLRDSEDRTALVQARAYFSRLKSNSHAAV